MNKLNLIVVILAMMLLPFMVDAQFSETRKMVKSYPILKDTQIEIINKYGKIEIKTWDNDSARFEIDIRVEEKKLSKLEDAIRGIDFDITDSDHYLIFRTELEKNKSGLAKELKKFKETLLNSDGNIQVDYTVWLPDSNSLKIENKFGDVFIGDYNGEVWIDLSNGNLKANDFTQNIELTLNFADATINNIKSGRLNCNFSELYLKRAESVRVISKSTEFDIQEIGDMNVESRRDKFRIRKADLIDAEGSFTNFRITEINDRVNIRSEYGDLEIENISSDFSNVTIQSKSTDVNLYFTSESRFMFDISTTKTELSFCSEMEIENEEISEDERTITQKGFFGGTVSESERVSITADSGSLNIRSN